MSTEIDRINHELPFSLEAEQALIASVLFKPSCLDEVEKYVSPDDFYLPQHVAIYSCMRDMYNKSKNVDVVTLISELVKLGTYDEAGGRAYLTQVATEYENALNAKDYARIIYEKSVLRTLINAGEQIAEDAYSENGDVEKQIEAAEKRVYDIAQGKRDSRGFIHIKDIMSTSLNELTVRSQNPESIKGVPTGYKDLDNMIVGLGDADVVIIGARPGVGKTAFALNIAVKAANATGKKVCIFSLEMSAIQLAERMISSEASVNAYKLRSGQLEPRDWRNIAKAAEFLSTCNILISDSSDVTVSSMMSKLRRERENLGLVIVDYLQLLSGDKGGGRRYDNRVVEVGDISRSLKLMAKELGVPVICCAQLSRGVEKTKEKIPMLSDLRESGSIEQDADIVMFIHRDYNSMITSENEESVAKIIVAKNRHGRTGEFDLNWIPQFYKFTGIDSEIQ